jgi:phosphonate transport system permease protein
MGERYYAGFMTKRPQFMRTLLGARKQVGVFLVDVVAILYVWFTSSYCMTMLFQHGGGLPTLPWWAVLVAVEAAALWENLGVSVGMKLLRLRLVIKDSASPTAVRRLVRFLVWHVSGLPLIGLVITSDGVAWHDRASGVRVVRPEDAPQGRRPLYAQSWFIAVALLILASIATAMLVTDVNLPALFTGAGKTAKIWAAFVNPDWSILGDGVRLLLVTIFMAFMATFFGVVVAAPLSFLAARNLTGGWIGRLVYFLVRTSMSIIRSIEPIIWAIIFIVWVTVGAFPGVLALFVHSVADLTKLYSERLESIDPGPVEALRATGAPRLQVVLYGIVPQIVNPFLSFTLYRWDINVRMATIIGMVGGGGIGQSLYQYTSLWLWRKAGVLMLLIMLTVWVMDYASARLRARLA